MNLQEKYQKQIIPELKEEMKLNSIMAVPRISKVVINIGLKEAKDDKKILEPVSQQIATITGQMPNVRRAKKSIAGFKLGKGVPVGLAVTLRGKKAFSFMEKLFNIVLPRVRDFSGIKETGFDGNGNFSFGVVEQIVFPEVDFSKMDKSRGLQITIVTNTKEDRGAKMLLTKLGMPFEKKA